MPTTIVLRVGTQFTYEHYPLIQLITNVYAFRNPNNGIWSTRISTNTGADSLLDDFIHDIEIGNQVSGKLFVLNSEYAAQCVHEMFKDFPWFVSVGLENHLILYVTDPTKIPESCTFVRADNNTYLFYDKAGNSYIVRITKTDHPIPANG